MSNNQDHPNSGNRQKQSNHLYICLFCPDGKFAHSLKDFLKSDNYALIEINHQEDFIECIENQKDQIDCLIFINKSSWQNLLSELKKLGLILPIVIINTENSHSTGSNIQTSENFDDSSIELYHNAEIQLEVQKIDQIASYINFAITQFLNLAPSCSLTKHATQLNYQREEIHNFLASQQKRLAEKLKERLGYLGVYYKRNPKDFYRNLEEAEKEKFLQFLSEEYRKIILVYFDDNPEINQLIDNFVDQAFFADISISQILEIHMELMDEFAQQLKLEGRSEEILLDYRLALIDIIAHLCEMYRRSIPRETQNDIAFDMFFPKD